MTNLRANALGDTTAENDQKMLTEAFVPTADFRTLIETDERTVVVGRRGTGKSALYLQLQKYWADDKKIVVLCFSPEDTEVIGFRSLLKPFSTSFNLARASTRLLWRYAMLMEIAAYIRGSYKLSHLVEDDEILREHLQRWNSVKGNLLTKCRHIAKIFLSSASPEEAVGDLPSNLELSHIENKVLSLTTVSERRFVLLLDRLDEGYEPDEIGIGIITGLVYASIELNKRSEKIRPIIFLRDNIYRAVAREDPDYSRNIEGQIIRLHWDWAQLLLLAASRMRVCFELDQEKDQRIWDRCTAGELQGRDGFKRCLQFTLYRPRDLLSLLNEAFYCASRNNRSTAILSDLEFAAKSISVARLEDLWKEYQKVFPSIQMVSNAFADGEPEFDVAAATTLLSGVIEKLGEDESQVVLRDIRLLEPSGILQGLYSVGFIGMHEVTTGAFTFCHDGRTPDIVFDDRSRLLIHPCYWLGLNLSRNALTPGEAEEITDEYDIKVRSITPEIRNTRIGQTIAQLEKISLGSEGQKDFELWCLDALRIAFAAHLTNIQAHPNGAAVQRRDIVGRNREESEFWRRVRSDYNVRQAIFEVKNYTEPGATEYRQLQSYLTGIYGTLGFMITRDSDEHPHSGKDLDWIKEMYQSHGVVLMKLPAKYICKLLQKLRSPDKHDVVDQQVGALLDTYERNYLGIKSTRQKKR
ncbi:ATP-binding protein [Ralstonia pseudosolanacearum]|uniref:P-loop ATPase, Sll1717 family n=1 Tax=Ralstonia pseudosolanacearum TaxID=1310165 RepID=UPI0026759893|nr:ATP-binding protein [Ralstonia pseudosolanacearum]MDO3510214.1 ATP-binding protein [Ralstonia pseudosolanacearum]MDO3515205.1 ATP-binding protein [Ralstonia pseudosolanacearum]MDO3609213.1 ATP-binding protein [Ralstonia pseudosolanacearum]MDO3614156.1 ATP-binding protein [Ralstonia pseudosolanacearum]MDO3634053.1 ATP-binding protein [Ralstonia pseudosolanacearum]